MLPHREYDLCLNLLSGNVRARHTYRATDNVYLAKEIAMGFALHSGVTDSVLEPHPAAPAQRTRPGLVPFPQLMDRRL